MKQILAQPLDQTGYVNVNLDLFSWQWLQISFWLVAILFIVVIVLAVYFIVYRKRTPKESDELRRGSLKHLSCAIIACEDGNADLRLADGEASKTGHFETKPVGKFKFQHRAFYSRPGATPANIDVTEKKDLDKTRQMAQAIIDLNSRKLHFRHAQTALWVGVESKALLMTIQAIAMIQMVEIYETLCEMCGQFFPIDVYAMKRMVFAGSYNESDINKLANIHEHIGGEKEKKGDQTPKIVLYVGIALIIMAMVALTIAALV